uniref:Putative secreted protein n=1 Tax=Ixodes ricinus TaxID=34613 RepID=A0A6B0UKH3_IXORI
MFSLWSMAPAKALSSLAFSLAPLCPRDWTRKQRFEMTSFHSNTESALLGIRDRHLLSRRSTSSSVPQGEWCLTYSARSDKTISDSSFPSSRAGVRTLRPLHSSRNCSARQRT